MLEIKPLTVKNGSNSCDRENLADSLSEQMVKRVSRLKSSYTSNFDWTVYDRLQEKFGGNPPRGGVLFGSNLKLLNFHNSCSMCHYTLEVDTYGRGCIHDCSYCYAKDTLTKHGYWNRPHPFPLDLSKVRKIFHTVFETNKASRWREILSKKIPIRVGSMSDSFMWMDQKLGITREFLRILNHYNYPYIIFTRSDLIAEDSYIGLLRPDLCSVQFSVSGADENLTKKIEPRAPSLARRFKALAALSQSGIRTAVRVNPLLPMYPDGYFTDERSIIRRFGSKKNVPIFPLFNIDQPDEFLDLVSEAGVSTLLVGFARLTGYSLNQMTVATGINFREFFKPEALMTVSGGNTDKNYSDSEIAYYYKIIQAAAHRKGLRFTTCYIGNGIKDYYKYQDLWSNKQDCCDVRGYVPSFKSSCQDISWEDRAKHAQNPEFIKRAIEDEKEWFDSQKFLAENIAGRLDGLQAGLRVRPNVIARKARRIEGPVPDISKVEL